MPKYKLTLKYDNEEKIKNRIAICLDTNVWIELAENNDPIVKAIRNKLTKLVDKGIIFCPLVEQIFMEFHRQNYDSIKRLFPLLDTLTLNLRMKNSNILYETEIKNFIYSILDNKKGTISRNEIFVPFACNVKDTLDCELPDFPNKQMMLSFFRVYHDKMINWKFSEYMFHMKDKIPQIIDVDGEKFQNEFIVRKEKAKGNKEKMHEIEEDCIIEEIIKPIFGDEAKKALINNPALASKGIQYFEAIKMDNKSKGMFIAKQILNLYPLLHNTLEVMTFSGFDTNRKGRKTDYEDFEIMIASVSYYDILFTKDRWIYSLLSSNKSKLISNTDFYQDYDSFNKYLDSLLITC